MEMARNKSNLNAVSVVCKKRKVRKVGEKSEKNRRHKMWMWPTDTLGTIKTAREVYGGVELGRVDGGMMLHDVAYAHVNDAYAATASCGGKGVSSFVEPAIIFCMAMPTPSMTASSTAQPIAPLRAAL